MVVRRAAVAEERGCRVKCDQAMVSTPRTYIIRDGDAHENSLVRDQKVAQRIWLHRPVRHTGLTGPIGNAPLVAASEALGL